MCADGTLLRTWMELLHLNHITAHPQKRSSTAQLEFTWAVWDNVHDCSRDRLSAQQPSRKKPSQNCPTRWLYLPTVRRDFQGEEHVSAYSFHF